MTTTRGITPTGFVAASADDIEADLTAGFRANVDPNIVEQDGEPLTEMRRCVASQAGDLWSVAATIYRALNPNDPACNGFVLDGVASYTGTKRLGATPSHVVCAMGLNGATTVPAGSLASVAGQPTNTWTLVGTGDPATGKLVVAGPVSSTTAGMYFGYFESTTTGPIEALAGMLSVIVNSVTGWNTVTNAADAILGTNREADADLRVRRNEEVAAPGVCTPDGLEADLLQVPNVLQARVFENSGDSVDATGLPPRSIRAVIFDGITPAADNTAIAKAIWANRGGGVATCGSTAVQLTDAQGREQVVTFDRAQVVPIYLALTVKTNPETFDAVNGPNLIKQALVAAGASSLNLGVSVIALRLQAAVLAVPGVVDLLAYAQGVAPSPSSGSNIAISGLQIAFIQSGNDAGGHSYLALTVT